MIYKKSTIDGCWRCNFHDRVTSKFFSYEVGSYCGYHFPNIKEIKDYFKIPKWCPLQDAEKLKECGYKEK